MRYIKLAGFAPVEGDNLCAAVAVEVTVVLLFKRTYCGFILYSFPFVRVYFKVSVI